MGCPLGERAGYTVRFEDATSASTSIRYVTEGMLLREAMLIDPLLSRYSVIIIDEAHERSLNTDILLAALKKIRQKRTDLRVIICSATIDAEAFFEYFSGRKYDSDRSDHDRQGIKSGLVVGDSDTLQKNRGTIISIDGRQFPVDFFYIDTPVSDYIQATVDTVLHLHFGEKLSCRDDGDVLCFLPSGEDVDRALTLASEALTSKLQHSNHDLMQLELLPLYSSLPVQQQMNVFRSKGSRNNRRVIFSTNIAETSVTVPNISIVIDCGFAKTPFFDPKTGFDRLITWCVLRH
jgi:ATP-dependent RNA helicase DDX35